MKRCQNCEDYFQELGDWQKLCKPCFAKSKKAEESHARDLEIEISRLRGVVGTLNRRIAELEAELLCLKKDNVFNPDLIKKIRVLAHPDKHNGSELSHNVSKVLNALTQKTNTCI
jgi:hypothetical protein